MLLRHDETGMGSAAVFAGSQLGVDGRDLVDRPRNGRNRHAGSPGHVVKPCRGVAAIYELIQRRIDDGLTPIGSAFGSDSVSKLLPKPDM